MKGRRKRAIANRDEDDWGLSNDFFGPLVGLFICHWLFGEDCARDTDPSSSYRGRITVAEYFTSLFIHRT